MIIKSTSRSDGSFGQLIGYQDEKALEGYVFSRNLGNARDAQSIQHLFEAHAERLASSPWKVQLYHEIISIPRNAGLGEHEHAEILLDLANRYLDGRGDLLAYGRIHMDHKHHAHLHLMLSANEVGKDRRHRMSRNAFRALQCDLEKYVLTHYPQLGDKALRQPGHQPQAITDAEYQRTKRTGVPTKRQTLKAQLDHAIKHSTSAEDLAYRLTKAGIDLRVRGKNITATAPDGFKARLAKLDLAHMQDALTPVADRMALVKERVASLRKAHDLAKSLEMDVDGLWLSINRQASNTNESEPPAPDTATYTDWQLPEIAVPDLPTRKPPKSRWVLFYEEQALTLIDTASHVVIGHHEAPGGLDANTAIDLLEQTHQRLGKPTHFKLYGVPPAWLAELESWLEQNGFPTPRVPDKKEIPRQFRTMRRRYLQNLS